MKKIIASILAFILCASVLCSCDKTKNEKQLAKERATKNIAMNAGKIIEGDKISSAKINVKVDGKKNDDKILFETDNIKVTLNSVSVVADTPCIIVDVENNSEKSICVNISNVCVNHCETVFSANSDVVEPNQTATLGINIFDETNGGNGFENTTYVKNAKTDNVEFEIGTFNSDDKNTNTGNISESKKIELDIGGKNLKIDAPDFAKKVYEDDNIAIWYCSKYIHSENFTQLRMFVQNKSDKTITINISNPSYDKDQIRYYLPYAQTDISADSTCFCTIYLQQKKSNSNKVSSMTNININAEFKSDDLSIYENTKLAFDL